MHYYLFIANFFLLFIGIFHELGEEDDALKVFTKGEQAFFEVLGQMLSSNTLKLDQCAATIAPIRQLVLSEASLLKEPGLFPNVILRWKCLFKQLRTHLIRSSSGEVFSAFFQWYTKQMASSKATIAEDLQAALLKQMQEEEQLLQTSAKSTLAGMAKTTYALMQNHLPDGVVTIDYIFFATLKKNPLLEAYCVIFESDTVPIVCKLDYKAIRNQAALVTKLMSQTSAECTQEKIDVELTLLAKTIFPPCLVERLTSRNISHLYISPDSDLFRIPMDMLPVSFDSSTPVPLFEQFSVSILPSMKDLFSYDSNCEIASDKKSALNQVCCIIGNPNFDLCKSATGSSAIEKLVNYFCGYFSISASAGPILEQLQHSQDEIEFISLRLKSCGLTIQNFVGDEAVLSNVLSLECPMLVHISSHAYSGTRTFSAFRGNFFDDLQSSAIALAGFNTFSRKQFNQLRSDCGPAQLPPLAIFSMKLQGTKLVYLSTCDSAAGTVPMQEAVDNLAIAFQIAGAETVIATLWPVPDQLAASFSKVFYEKLTIPDVRPSEALAYAKQCFKKFDITSYRHCSCYVCYGLDKPFLLT